MNKGFMMTTDAALALLIASATIVIVHYLLITTPLSNRDQLQAIASDAAALIENSRLKDVQEIVDTAPRNTCLLATISRYDNLTLISKERYSSQGCPSEVRGENVIARRTYIDDYNYLIIVKGWRLSQ